LTHFNDFALNPAIVKAVAAKGYTTPTPIQAQAIPPVMSGKDLLGVAQTGTGKTAAFALPILHRLAANRVRPTPKHCRALVLSPTRELATQIAESFRAYGGALGLSVATVFGGVKYGAQIKALSQGVDVLVATPGRLIDHMQEGHLNLSAVEVFVLDEADQMLDLGFFQPIRKIVARLPMKRQNLFFSATMPKEIKALASDLLKDPVEVAVTPPAATADRVSQQILFIETARKRVLLAELYADGALSRTIVFTRTKRGADRVAKHLDLCGISAAAIHGDKSQPQREKALAAFKAGQVRALVATDIAARGIDVSDVTHVINFELPNVPESYVHRIGRTARAGAEGKAISLVGDDERNLLRDIQKVTRQTIPSFDRRNDKHLAQAQAAEAHLGFHSPGEGEGLETRRGGAAAGERSGARSGERRPQPKPQAKAQPSKKQRQKFPGARRDGGHGRDDARQVDNHRADGSRPAGRYGAPSSGYEPLKEAAAGEGATLKRRRRRRSGGRGGPAASQDAAQ
jgi:ATP-dependent RNA helicase RhlE